MYHKIQQKNSILSFRYKFISAIKYYLLLMQKNTVIYFNLILY